MDYFIVDTNVLLVAVYNEHAGHPARANARTWLKEFYHHPMARITFDCTHSDPFYLNESNSKIIGEYVRNIDPGNADHKMFYEYLLTPAKIGKRLCRIIEYDGLGVAVLPTDLASRVDPSDRKFVALALQHREYEPAFRPAHIVYADDLLDWAACRPYLEEKGIVFINLNDGNPDNYRSDLKYKP